MSFFLFIRSCCDLRRVETSEASPNTPPKDSKKVSRCPPKRKSYRRITPVREKEIPIWFLDEVVTVSMSMTMTMNPSVVIVKWFFDVPNLARCLCLCLCSMSSSSLDVFVFARCHCLRSMSLSLLDVFVFVRCLCLRSMNRSWFVVLDLVPRLQTKRSPSPQSIFSRSFLIHRSPLLSIFLLRCSSSSTVFHLPPVAGVFPHRRSSSSIAVHLPSVAVHPPPQL